ncbi:hypothetical protein BGX29_002861 [Mortierella sp. GBA35]|nr:hypothetical protein BGX29_002861 [Mortierella sp. GBA35]
MNLSRFHSQTLHRHARHIKFLLTRYTDTFMSLMRLLEDSDDNDDDNDMDRDRDKAAAGSGLYLVGLEILAHRKLDYLSSRDDEVLLSFLEKNP